MLCSIISTTYIIEFLYRKLYNLQFFFHFDLHLDLCNYCKSPNVAALVHVLLMTSIK